MKLLLSALLVFVFSSGVSAAPAAPDAAYPLETCVVSGEDLGSMGDPVIYWHKVDGQPDREIRFCCERCQGRFESNPDKYLAKLDAAKTAQQACCATADCCTDGTCAECADGTCEKACCEDGKCEACAAPAA